MYILIVSILCAIMLSVVRQMAYDNPIENLVVAILLFAAIDTSLRAILKEPSWAIKVIGKNKK
jgi:hypothetical protein